MTALPALSDIADEYELLDSEDRYRLLIELGRKLEPMPDALKTDATKVRGCSSSTWVYPTRLPDGRLHFLADSNAAITKGVVALILSAVQDRQPAEVAATGHPGAARAVQPDPRAFVQPHAGRSQHDRAGPRNRRAAGRGMSDDPTYDPRTGGVRSGTLLRTWPAITVMAARWAWNIGNRRKTGSSWPCPGAKNWSAFPRRASSRPGRSSACSIRAAARRCGWRSAISSRW